jgi:hypothetical protein
LFKWKCDDEALVYSLLDLFVINGGFQWSLNYMMQLQASPSAFQFPASGNNFFNLKKESILGDDGDWDLPRKGGRP